jgi:SAM-dependent methyltransferase
METSVTESLAREWVRVIAPTTGDVRTELVGEAAEFLGITVDEGWRRLGRASDRFVEEWRQQVDDPTDPEALTRFYNRTDSELFELIEWHANDPIHYRTLIVRDLAAARHGRRVLDYGSGIGNDALVLAEAGFKVTIADIADPLLSFAAWRLRRRGFEVKTIDLKSQALPERAYDLVACFDVLEHIPRPLDVVRNIRRALDEGGLFVMHAPFGDDPVHPMHVVHCDVVTPRMRSLGFQPVDCWFPPGVWAPRIYERASRPALERAGYFVYDNYLNNRVGARLAAFYRQAFRRSAASSATSQ